MEWGRDARTTHAHIFLALILTLIAGASAGAIAACTDENCCRYSPSNKAVER
jgi:hypothetical protein